MTKRQLGFAGAALAACCLLPVTAHAGRNRARGGGRSGASGSSGSSGFSFGGGGGFGFGGFSFGGRAEVQPRKAPAVPSLTVRPLRGGELTTEVVKTMALLEWQTLNHFEHPVDARRPEIGHSGDEPGDVKPLRLLIPTGSALTLTLTNRPDFVNYTREGAHPKYDLGNAGPGGAVSFTALLPVSGHFADGGLTKNQTARKMARENKYNVIITHADGSEERVDNLASAGMVTPLELSLKLLPGKTLVQFHPVGTGVGGFLNGRTIELNYPGGQTL